MRRQLTWRLSDAQGAEIDDLVEPVEFFVGGEDLLAKVEEAIDGQAPGYAATVHLEPDQAFGEYDAKLVFFEPREAMPEGVDVGMQFEGPPPGAATPGLRDDALYTVTEVYPDHVVFDGNHPLAGIALRLALVVRDVREASEEEIEAGSVVTSPVTLLDAGARGPHLH